MTERNIHDQVDELIGDTDLPDPPPQRFEDLPEEQVYAEMINHLRYALNRVAGENDPEAVIIALDDYMPGMRAAWLRAFAWVCGPFRTAQAAGTTLEGRHAAVYGNAEPSLNHLVARAGLSTAMGHMIADAADRAEEADER